MNNKLKRVVLISMLVLPVFIYIVIVYGQKGVFFETLEYVGPKSIVENDLGSFDTIPYKVPNFELVNKDGAVITEKDLEGKFYVMSFFFSSCPSICPKMNFHLKQISDRFKGVDDFYILSVTVDPDRDTLEALQSYSKSLHVKDRNWYFLRGSQEYAYQLAAKYFLSANKDSLADGGFYHSSSVALVDWQGNLRSRKDDYGNVIGIYDVMSVAELNKLEEDIKVVLAEYERWKNNQDE